MPEWVLQVAGVLGAGVGAYAAIRSDLARMNERLNNVVLVADKAHQRIDQLIARG